MWKLHLLSKYEDGEQCGRFFFKKNISLHERRKIPVKVTQENLLLPDGYVVAAPCFGTHKIQIDSTDRCSDT
jgi:hypothetical protein